MSIDFVLFTPTLNRFEDCNRLLLSAMQGTKKPVNMIVLDNSAGGFEPISEVDTDDLTIVTADKNIGVARSFNYALDIAQDFPGAYVVISNDDLILREDTLAELERGIMENPDELIYCTGGLGLNSFSLFACDPVKLIAQVGYFETAYFSYLEDNDLAYRIRLLGKDLCRIPGCEVTSHVGSATIAAYTHEQMDAFHRMRAIGEREYVKKWGGLPHSETNSTPYNSGVDAVTWHRAKFSKVSPY